MPTNSCPSWSSALVAEPCPATRWRIRSLSSAAACLGEREGDDRPRLDAVGEQGGDPLRDDLGLAGAGRRDDLQVRPAVSDRVGRLACQNRGGQLG